MKNTIFSRTAVLGLALMLVFAAIGFALSPPTATRDKVSTNIDITATATDATSTAATNMATRYGKLGAYAWNAQTATNYIDNNRFGVGEARAVTLPDRYKRFTPNIDEDKIDTTATGRNIKNGPLKRGATGK